MNNHPSGRDIFWNYGSTALAGLLGIALPLLVGAWYEVSVLGVFNKVFALYMVFSQVAAFGIHLSVVKYVAEESAKENGDRHVLPGALVALLPPALCAAALLCLLAPPAAEYMRSPATKQGLYWASGGVFFFACNKSLLAFLNAQMRLREYAVYNALRYALMSASLVLLYIMGVRSEHIPSLFLMAESMLFCLLLYAARACILRPSDISAVLSWAKRHLWFGFRAIGGHIMLGMNSKIDVLCLGFLVDDASLGIYSMAAILVEAANQFPVVLRTAYTPRQIILVGSGQVRELQALAQRLRMYVWLIMGAAAVVAVILYPHVIPWLTGKAEYAQGAEVFCVLMVGMTIGSGYVPFNLLLGNSGLPERQTQMLCLLTAQNLLGIVLLVPQWGILGAAVSTATTYIMAMALIKFFVYKYLRCKI